MNTSLFYHFFGLRGQVIVTTEYKQDRLYDLKKTYNQKTFLSLMLFKL